MRALVFCEADISSKSCQQSQQLDQHLSVLATLGQVTVSSSVSQVEKLIPQQDFDVLILITAKLTGVLHGFVLRLLNNKPLTIIVNAQQWHQDQLNGLLDCGRITFVPGDLAADRLVSLVNLAQTRFIAASKTWSKLQKLDEEMRSAKLINQAKLIVMQQGFDETKAHKIILQQAMQKGLSVVQMATQIIAIMNPGGSKVELGAPHYGAHITKVDMTQINL
ncbi:ANTAR domain-containing response regulator [Shewanella aestuarii]|uniref:ANTAR domain-containing protein n=1 Tax=Shewanella aestuarii TaxID=1028752 RepID=A0A6G9QIB0_9GAMM|nr:ANTAR domain-containing protein [Shewanella aestuarii]QIR14280.1 ANTAR domain-containing protein [Shewanella aestuarii]